MKIQITIPDDAIADVKEYFKELLGKDYKEVFQERIDSLVKSAVDLMKQHRQIRNDLDEFQKGMKDFRNGN